MNFSLKQVCAICAGVFLLGYLMQFVYSCNTRVETQTVIKTDSTQLKAQAIIYEKKIDETRAWYDKLLGIHKQPKPVEVIQGNIATEPLKPIKLPPDTIHIHDTVRTERPYDLMFDIERRGSDFTIYTFNPYLRALEKQAWKIYRFQSPSDNFDLLSDVATDEGNIEGIKLIERDSPIRWRGLFLGASYALRSEWYVSLSCRFDIYKHIEVEPEVRSEDHPLWVTARYRFLK
jgi:hypothetical protein